MPAMLLLENLMSEQPGNYDSMISREPVDDPLDAEPVVDKVIEEKPR
jgi:hypothetical protein